MPDRPPDNPEQPTDPAHTLNDILAALARVGEDAPLPPPEEGEGRNPVGAAVAELSAALDQLFTLVRTERAEQRARVTELEAALSAAHARIRQLEAGEGHDAIPAPPPNDFGQLREAAERLRRRTEELFREAGPVAHDEIADAASPVVHDAVAEAKELAEAEAESVETAASAELPIARPPSAEDEAEARIRAARDAVESSIADEQAAAAGDLDPGGTDEAESAEDHAPEEFAKPAILRVFPGAKGPEEAELDVESDLAIEEDRGHPVAVALPPLREPEPDPAPAPEPEASAEPDPEPTADPEQAPESAATSDTPPAQPQSRAEPIELLPRPARKRRAALRRRRIDARKLERVDPATALRAMVSAIDDIWTAGVSLDLAIALTDGSTLKVTGGHNKPLAVDVVEPGAPARTTVTATTAQLVPLFGRLELSGEQSPPLIHGPRRDADLLVGWIDRAQRLEAQPL